MDANIAMIPKADGDSTPLGQRNLSVLPVVYRLWASLRLGYLREWVEGWLSESVFSFGNGLSSVEAWFTLRWMLRRFLPGLVGISCMSWSLVLSNLLTRWTGPFWIALLDVWVCLAGFKGLILHFVARFVSGSSLLLALGSHGVGMVVFPKGVFIVALCVPWCRHLESMPDVKPQLHAENLKCRCGASWCPF